MNYQDIKHGDKIRKSDGTTFSNGEYVATANMKSVSWKPKDSVWLLETGFHLPAHELEPAYPSGPKEILEVTLDPSAVHTVLSNHLASIGLPGFRVTRCHKEMGSGGYALRVLPEAA